MLNNQPYVPDNAQQVTRNKIQRQQRALTVYFETGNVTKACAAVGCTRGQWYKWLKDSKFAAAAKLAEDALVDDLESEALSQGLGQTRPTSYVYASFP